MKRAIFILTLGLCLLLSDGAHAQRALPAMRGLEIRGGMTDGFYTRDSRSETGYWFGLAMSRYAKNADKWVFGAEFLNRYYPYKSERIPGRSSLPRAVTITSSSPTRPGLFSSTSAARRWPVTRV